MVSGTFNSPYRGTFHLSLTLLYAIGRDVVFSLGRWTSRIHTEFHEIRATLEHPEKFAISLTGLSPCIVRLSRLFGYRFLFLAGVRNPGPAGPVWAVPLSLAATDGISIDVFSCRYLDVSVLCVRSTHPMHSGAGGTICLHSSAGFPHSEISGSKFV